MGALEFVWERTLPLVQHHKIIVDHDELALVFRCCPRRRSGGICSARLSARSVRESPLACYFGTLLPTTLD